VKSLLATILLLLLCLSYADGQGPVGSWSDHLSYFTARRVALSPADVYASTGSSIIVFNREFEELKKISRVHGLTETSISTIGWSQENGSLIIAYSSTNIDILKNSTVINIPDIKRKYITGKKEIYRIKTRGKYAYLATSFGIVVIDIAQREVYDTWKPGTGDETAEVYDVDISSSRIYAATNMGIWWADLSNPGLSYFGNWTRENSLPSPSGNYNAVVVHNDKVYVNRSDEDAQGDSIYVVDAGSSLFSYQTGLYNNSFDPYTGGFTISSKWMVRIFNNDGALVKAIESYNPGNPDAMHAVYDGQDIWIADKSSGLIRGKGMTEFVKLNLPGPYTNNVSSIINNNGKTFFTGGAVDNAWNNQWRPLQIAQHSEKSWHTIISYDLNDAMRVLPDPQNREHFWVSTWGAGLLEYENNTLVNTYNDSNSPLETIIPGRPYSRICGLAMDRERNIWIAQTGVPGSIKVLKADGTWIVNPVTIEAPTIGDMIIAQNGFKWVVLPRGYGLYILDDNKTPDIFTDDRHKQMLVKDSDNKVISNVYSIAEDLDGNIWVGTDQGPAIYYNPASVFDNDPKAFRVKIPRNDGTDLADYMLGTEIITSISVDGANRKWLGTFSSGAYLLSSDGSVKLINYNEDNSPILSNTVVAVDVDDTTGEVWFGTALGVISVRGNSTAGGEGFGDVYTFPNPVRESYSGNVTITGLMRNTRVRITDISGNLVYRTISDGGQATWDLTTYTGKRVSTGVYLVFCASEDGSYSTVTKMLVIR
jgi:hypothetical protein